MSGERQVLSTWCVIDEQVIPSCRGEVDTEEDNVALGPDALQRGLHGDYRLI